MNDKFEEILNKALELKKEGKSVPEILALFPEQKKELEEMFETIKILARQKEKILPPKELLSKIITNTETERYSYREEKGRPSIINIIFNQIHNFMAPKLKLTLALIAIVAVIGIFSYYQLGLRAPQQLAKEGVLPKATGNIDDAVISLLQDASSEELFFENELSGDISLVNMDSQAIDDFGQSYNEI